MFKATLKQKTTLSPKATGLTLQLIEPTKIEFNPGQFVNLKVADAVYRAYSIASPCAQQDKIFLIVTTSHEGVGSEYVRNLHIGDEVTFIGPSGKLHLKEKHSKAIYFFATGSGIAPFISMLEQLACDNYSGKIHLFFGVRHPEEVLCLDELTGLKKRLKDFTIDFYVSNPQDDFMGVKGRVTAAIPNITDFNADFYLCGHPQMVEDVNTALKAKGVPDENIICEGFTKTLK